MGGWQPKNLVMLPVYNEGEQLELVLGKVFSGVRSLEYELGEQFNVLAIDDGSRDGSRNILERKVMENPKKISLIVHSDNLGITQTLKEGFEWAINNQYSKLIGTDADAEQDQKEVIIKASRSITTPGVQLSIARMHVRGEDFFSSGYRNLDLENATAAYINEKYGLALSPPICPGNYAFRTGALERIMNTDYIKNYSRKWAIMLAAVLVANALYMKPHYFDITRSYLPERRPTEKVLKQLLEYRATVDELHKLPIAKILSGPGEI